MRPSPKWSSSSCPGPSSPGKRQDPKGVATKASTSSDTSIPGRPFCCVTCLARSSAAASSDEEEESSRDNLGPSTSPVDDEKLILTLRVVERAKEPRNERPSIFPFCEPRGTSSESSPLGPPRSLPLSPSVAASGAGTTRSWWALEEPDPYDDALPRLPRLLTDQRGPPGSGEVRAPPVLRRGREGGEWTPGDESAEAGTKESIPLPFLPGEEADMRGSIALAEGEGRAESRGIMSLERRRALEVLLSSL
mmetsp:Transcript_60244/g.160296  ORF Transcript_60244/g.160296 Transcript_60244/m.160296 type:complete len:250 (+) Transcript_60244:236-985(+)